MVGTSQKWPAKAGGRSPKGPAVAGTTVKIKHPNSLPTNNSKHGRRKDMHNDIP